MSTERNVIGVDVGGTTITVGLVNRGVILEKRQVMTPALESKETVVGAIVEAIAATMADKEVKGVGIGVPGLLDEDAGIVYDVTNIPSWDEVYLASAVSKALDLEVFLTNDANCFVLGEKCYGNGKSYKSIVGLTLGTGLGAGYVINDALHSGLMSSAGEIAIMPYLNHHYEHYCSGQFFKKEFGLTGEDVFKQALAGDEVALGIYHQFGIHLGHLIKQLLHVLAPEAIFFGGSIKDAFPYFEPAMWQTLKSFPYARVLDRLCIAQSEINDAAVLGAAALFEMRHVKSLEVDA